MKQGKKRLISGVIFSCLAISQNTSFANVQKLEETNNYSDVLKDTNQLADIKAIAKDLETPFMQHIIWS